MSSTRDNTNEEKNESVDEAFQTHTDRSLDLAADISFDFKPFELAILNFKFLDDLKFETIRAKSYNFFDILHPRNIYPDLSFANQKNGKPTSHDANIWLLIFCFLNVKDLLAARFTCKVLANIRLTKEIHERIDNDKLSKAVIKKINQESIETENNFFAQLHKERDPIQDMRQPSFFKSLNLDINKNVFPDITFEKTEEINMPGEDGFILKHKYK